MVRGFSPVHTAAFARPVSAQLVPFIAKGTRRH
jgi:hypothetical protein